MTDLTTFPILALPTPLSPEVDDLLGILQAAHHALDALPPSRERSIATTHLHECALWISQAVLRQVTGASPIIAPPPGFRA